MLPCPAAVLHFSPYIGNEPVAYQQFFLKKKKFSRNISFLKTRFPDLIIFRKNGIFMSVKNACAAVAVLMMVMLWVPACSLVELEDSRDEQEGWVSPVPLTGKLYAVGVDWEKGYDWHHDPAPGSVACSLVVWVDGRLAIRIPAGPEYGVNTDPDSFRMIRGKLYTLGIQGNETLVKVNGKEIFRYAGKEALVEMAVEGDTVYTLTNSCRGRGCALRRNGEILFESSTGTAYEHMEGRDGNYIFAYREADARGGTGYFWYDGKKACPVDLPAGTVYVEDLMAHEGKIAAFLWMDGVEEPVLLDDRRLIGLLVGNPVQGQMNWCRLADAGEGKVAVCGSFGMYTTAFWLDEKRVGSYIGFAGVWGMRVVGGQILAYQKSYHSLIIADCAFWKDELIVLPKGYTAYGWKPVCLWQGQVYAALTPRGEGHPVIWTSSGSAEVGINGCLFEIGVSD